MAKSGRTPAKRGAKGSEFTFKELDESTWPDFERLFERHGVPSYCWCYYYQREVSREREMRDLGLAEKDMRDHNRRKKKDLVAAGRAHGVLVYSEGSPVGWCAYGPREEYPRVDRGRFYKKLDLPEERRKLWRIVCMVVDKDHRGKGVAAVALKAALASIRRQGGGGVEAYPLTSKKGGSQSLWFGTVRMFEREGFADVAPLGSSRLMRKVVR
ncbi:MAG: GNAT family N-acetyltransferase [Methanobacteriota archaeon]|nr:MAG: GNAT family N-acetyltransferase [Euryarchaeota archaeon]